MSIIIIPNTHLSLRSLNNNAHEVHLSSTSTLLFSYGVCVAARFDGIVYATSQKWSATTTRHIRAFIGGDDGTTRHPVYYLPQHAFSEGRLLDPVLRDQYRMDSDERIARMLASL
jgi:hypothetical protein